MTVPDVQSCFQTQLQHLFQLTFEVWCCDLPSAIQDVNSIAIFIALVVDRNDGCVSQKNDCVVTVTYHVVLPIIKYSVFNG